MPISSTDKLSANFSLGELVASSTAARDPALTAKQKDPPDEVARDLRYLCNTLLQPIRDAFGFPIEITSGYRCAELNQKVGGTASSQHVAGQAADCRLSPRFPTDPQTLAIRSEIREGVRRLTKEEIRPDVSANFYLFAFSCLELERLDIDQVIHEHGEGPGRPGWVHLSTSQDTGRRGRQILRLASGLSRTDQHPSLNEALMLGTSPGASAPSTTEERALETGSNPAEFRVAAGESIDIRVTPIRTGALVSANNASNSVIDVQLGRLFRFTPAGTVNDMEYVMLTCQFAESADPPAQYDIAMAKTGSDSWTAAPSVYQLPAKPFPQSTDVTLSFVITA